MARIPIGVQMYTLRDETAKDFIGTLRRVAEIGYDGVEFAGYGGLSAAEMTAVLSDLNLKALGAHIGVDQFTNDLNGVIEYMKAIGGQYVIVPWAKQDSAEEVKQFAAQLNSWGETCRQHGLTLCYHNHAHEFVQYDGQYALDMLYAGASADNLKAELDLYWVKKGGLDPAAYIQQYAGRTPLLHIKDMDANGEFTEFGTGIIDWDAVFAVAPQAGAQWYIVEQDVCKRPCLESVAISFENLKKRGMTK